MDAILLREKKIRYDRETRHQFIIFISTEANPSFDPPHAAANFPHSVFISMLTATDIISPLCLFIVVNIESISKLLYRQWDLSFVCNVD